MNLAAKYVKFRFATEFWILYSHGHGRSREAGHFHSPAPLAVQHSRPWLQPSRADIYWVG